MEKENFLIEAHDKYGDSCFKDSVNGKQSSERKPQGYVEIYEVDKDGEKKLVGKSNLVVLCGRETIITRALDVTNSSLPSGATKDEFICWLGVGSGGVPSGDPLGPIAPTNNDQNLYFEIPLNSADATCGDYRIGPGGIFYYYKRPFDSVTYEMDYDNSDAWLVTRIISTITIFDANGYNISEAGLFTAASRSAGYSGHFTLYSRVTFPTIVKTASRQLVFLWYLYF